MSRATADDQLRFLLSCVKHSNNGKIDFVDVARECKIVSKGAAAKRYERLMRTSGILPGTEKLSAVPQKSKSKAHIAKAAAAKQKRIEDERYDIKQDDEEEDFKLGPTRLELEKILPSTSEPDAKSTQASSTSLPASVSQSDLSTPEIRLPTHLITPCVEHSCAYPRLQSLGVSLKIESSTEQSASNVQDITNVTSAQLLAKSDYHAEHEPICTSSSPVAMYDGSPDVTASYHVVPHISSIIPPVPQEVVPQQQGLAVDPASAPSRDLLIPCSTAAQVQPVFMSPWEAARELPSILNENSEYRVPARFDSSSAQRIHEDRRRIGDRSDHCILIID